MTLPFTLTNLTVGAIVLGLLGIVECFFGYRFFRIVLAIVGFFVGAGIAIALVNTDQSAVNLLAGVIGGLIGATIFYFLYFLGTFLAGIALGATVAAILAGNLGLTASATNIVVLVGAVIGGILGFVLSKYIIMLSTAVTGATQIVYALLLLLPGTHVLVQGNRVDFRLDQSQGLLVTLGILLLAAVGFAVQYGMNHHRTVVVTRQDTVV